MDDEAQLAPSLHPVAGLQGFLEELGPGLITGAADDDPSGISTYSVVGASFGYATLWTALLSFPLMAAVQLMCARLGMVTGCGLASVIRTRYSRWVLWFACSLVAIANIFNIGADLGGMAEATQMITGVRAYFWAPFFAALILGLLFWTSYRTMARIFKWLTLVLFAYIITAFLARPDWTAVMRATFVPHIEFSKQYMAVLVGISEPPSRLICSSGRLLRKWKKTETAGRLPSLRGGELQIRSSAPREETSSLVCCFLIP